jgi:hypothetical protein
MERLNRTADLIDAEKRIVVSQVSEPVESAQKISCNLPWLLAFFERELAVR